MKPIAYIHTDFPQKFGIPRQSGLVPGLCGRVVFLPAYRNADALRGLEGYSHIWLLWEFSEAKRESWSPTVRPPRLGGNRRMGVFATRSPFRPNPIGLSCVRLLSIEGTDLIVEGADLLDGTPIYDIKPYLPYTDAHPDAATGFAGEVYEDRLTVTFPPALLEKLPKEKRESAVALLRGDPRPSYQEDEERVYGMPFAGYDIRFTVAGESLTVVAVEKL
ncbi:MAG: tRNA (N6-threonylcarbamoyladenosine(37)-N6)-methyltransferase TrmO [Clostridia bacterium]|nr:tRNA (N6-threonylcarbamoyladenosine(37)-N6)-methyltransferase TrmO [Clostridia bacterium]